MDLLGELMVKFFMNNICVFVILYIKLYNLCYIGWENIGSYLSSSTKRTLTGLSNPSDDQVRAAIVERFHNAGKKLMVSAFGATDHPIQRGGNAQSIGTQIGNIVRKYGLDGVDIDNEETAYLGVNGVGAKWLCDLTNAIRAVLPKSQGYLYVDI